jgi:hypothetical protein
LEEDGVLRIDERIRDLEIEIRLGTGIRDAGCWGYSAVDSLKLGACSLRDVS